MRHAAKEVQFPDEDITAVTDAELLEKRYIKSEDRIALRKSLMKIKQDSRQALWLVYFEDMSVSDTAKALGKSKHATEMLLSRARAALKEQLIKDGFVYENL